MTKNEAVEKQFESAVNRFEEALREKKTDFIRDSAILRFEFTFDLAWKYLKKYLHTNKNIICMSPNDCFKEAYQQGFIRYTNKWIDMAKQRNAAVHTYKEALAKALYKKLPGYLKLFKKLEVALKKS